MTSFAGAAGGSTGPRRSSSLTLRLVGLFCLVAGVLAIVGAVTGWDTKGTPRAALWVAGIVLLLISLPCLFARGPKVQAAAADPSGLTIGTRTGASEQIGWNEISTVRLKGIGAPPHTAGFVLDLSAATPALEQHRRVGRWARPRDGAAGHLILPVPSHVGHALDAQLRQFAGVRYTPGS